MRDLLTKLGLEELSEGASTGRPIGKCAGPEIESFSPGSGAVLGRVRLAGADGYERIVQAAREAFPRWRGVPAPQRGEIVRQVAVALREKKDALGDLVSLEMGKIRAEGLGEVQEMIDICDFAVGLSRQLYGKTMPSERTDHRMFEQWHPLGVVGVVTAFNFPVAVWAWNAAIAWVCGDVVLWKPSEKVPLCALACQKIVHEVFARNGFESGVSNVVCGTVAEVGERLIGDNRIPLVSATGSVRMGRRVAAVVQGRLGRVLLELGGNNGVIVTPEADLELTVRAILFGALGTAGQRCTSIRRVIAHESVYDELKSRLVKAYGQARVGDPLDEGTLVGPLIDCEAVAHVQGALKRLREMGARIACGGETLDGDAYASGCYMKPALVEADPSIPLIQEETFGPLLYLMRYEDLDEAIAIHNAVPQGLSSAIFTRNLQEAETFLSARGSDCGIANVNLGTSGAEIGGAFGGEKDTGGGRESGSDAWKAYMRRQTVTINWSDDLPLAQGIHFG